MAIGYCNWEESEEHDQLQETAFTQMDLEQDVLNGAQNDCQDQTQDKDTISIIV